jgi:tight adherence protein C
MLLPLMLATFLFVLLLSVITVYGYRAYVRPSRIYDRVGGTADPGVPIGAAVGVKPRELVIRVFEQIGEQIPLSPADQTVSKRDLVMAGFRADGAIAILVGIKLIFCITMFIFAFLLKNHITENPVLRIVWLVAGTGLGYYAPSFYLESLVKKRQMLLRLALPDALDMLVVAVEAGLGLDQALQYVSREIEHSHPELSEELGLVGLEMRPASAVRSR